MSLKTTNKDTSVSFSPINSELFLCRVDMPWRKDKDKELKKTLDKMRKDITSSVSNVKSWHTSYDSHKLYPDVTKELIGDIYDVLVSPRIFGMYYEELTQLMTPHNFLLRSSWLSVQDGGEFVAEHNHGIMADLAFCYYIDVGETSAPINFISYSSHSLLGAPKREVVPFYPKSHELLIFPSILYHSVDPTVGMRYTYAGNVSANVRVPEESSFAELLFDEEEVPTTVHESGC